MLLHVRLFAVRGGFPSTSSSEVESGWRYGFARETVNEKGTRAALRLPDFDHSTQRPLSCLFRDMESLGDLRSASI
jgi:hypothetical protein